MLPNTSIRLLIAQSNFFDESGHSILAQRIFFWIKREWGEIDIPIRVIFQLQSLENLVVEVDWAQDPVGLRLEALPLVGHGDVEDEAYAADARYITDQLTKTILTAEANWGYMASAPIVPATGATSFLGSYVVYELLEGPAWAHVIAYLRAGGAVEGLARLNIVIKAYSLCPPNGYFHPDVKLWLGTSENRYLVFLVIPGDIFPTSLI